VHSDSAQPGLVARREMTPRQRRIVTAGIMVTLFLAALESTVVATAMPTIVARLGGLAIYSWVFSAFLLTSTISMPLWGRLSDIEGRRPIFLAGIALFLAGSALCGAARSMGALVAFRAIQGLGAGGLIPISLTIIGEIYDLEQRAKMQAYFSGVWGVASVLGPLVGGVITDYISWRWVFYINIPIGAAAMLIVTRGFHDAGREEAGKGMDLRAGAAFTLGLASLFGALLLGGDRWAWGSPPILALFALCAAFMALFVREESRSESAILPLGLLRDRVVATAVANGFFAGMAMFGALAFIPLFVQGVLGTSATGAGKVLLPFTLAWVIAATIGARLMLRTGARPPILGGMALLIAGFALMARLDATTTPATVALYLSIAGIGMGFVFVIFLVAVQTRVRTQELGVATSLVTFMRSTGATIGVAIMGTLVRSRMAGGLAVWRATHREIAALIPPADLDALLRNPGLLVTPGTRERYPAALLESFRQTLAHAIDPAFKAGLIAAILGLVAAAFYPAAASRARAAARQA